MLVVSEKMNAAFTDLSKINFLAERMERTAINRKAIPAYSPILNLSPISRIANTGTHTIRS